MNTVIYIFICLWLAAAIGGLLHPEKLIRSFRSLSKILNIDPDNIKKGDRFYCRIIAGVGSIFGLSVLAGMLTGHLHF